MIKYKYQRKWDENNEKMKNWIILDEVPSASMGKMSQLKWCKMFKKKKGWKLITCAICNQEKECNL